MICKLSIREAYGRLFLDPANDIAAGFAALLGTKTLTRRAVLHIEKLGFTIEALGIARDWREAI
jgi:hypothetical protein